MIADSTGHKNPYSPNAAGWQGENYLAIEQRADARGQLFLEPQYAVILTSRADSAPAGIAAVHRGKQGCENAWKGPLIDLGLHRPRCRSLAANRAWLCCAHMAQLLLQTLQLRASEARKRHLRPKSPPRAQSTTTSDSRGASARPQNPPTKAYQGIWDIHILP